MGPRLFDLLNPEGIEKEREEFGVMPGSRVEPSHTGTTRGHQPVMETSLPVQGRTPSARHAGYAGAVRAVMDRPRLNHDYLHLLVVSPSRGLSDYEAARILGRAVSSLCSTRNALQAAGAITATGFFEETSFGSKRARYTVTDDWRSSYQETR